MPNNRLLALVSFVALSFVGCSFAFSNGACGERESTISASSPITGRGQIYRVIDGDTLIINARSQAHYRAFREAADAQCKLDHLNDKHKSIRVRLFGVNTDESKHPNSDRNTPSGNQAYELVKSEFEGDRVRFTCYSHGYYGRSICSVESNHNDIGLWIINNGLSHYERGFGDHPNKNMHSKYLAAENDIERDANSNGSAARSSTSSDALWEMLSRLPGMSNSTAKSIAYSDRPLEKSMSMSTEELGKIYKLEDASAERLKRLLNNLDP